MDRKTVLTKTAKGLMEVTGKTSLLPRDLRNVLSQVDGKANVGDLHKKLDRYTETKLIDALGRLVRDGFVREFVSAPTSLAPPSQVPIVHEDVDLDFSALMSSQPAKSVPSKAEITAQNHAEADDVARQVAQARAQQQAEQKARDEAEAKARAVAEAKARAEAEAKAKAAAEAQARAEAEAQAKREAEAQAKREAEARAKREAEERAKREAEERARKEAEERTKREAEDRARKETEARAKKEAEERARREAAEKARRESEERARREAEEKTRREVEQEARRQLEERARKEAEERARRDAEERARREAEEQARRAAEAKARQEAEERTRKESEARAKREAEERAQREAEAKARQEGEARARRDMEERTRREAEAGKQAAQQERLREEMAERVRRTEERARREAEERRKAEEQSRREAAERAAREAEEREWRQAEERSLREAEERTRREVEAQERHAQEARALRAATEQAEQRAAEETRADDEVEHLDIAKQARDEEKARAKADAEAAARARREDRAREKAEAEERASAKQKALEKEASAVAARLERIRSGKKRSVGRYVGIAFMIAIVAGLLYLHFMPIELARYEAIASSRIGAPVKMGSGNFALFPSPSLRFENVRVGAGGNARIEVVTAIPEIFSVLVDNPQLKSIELRGVTLDSTAVAALLFGETKGGALGLEQIRASGVKANLPGVSLPELEATATLQVDGVVRKIVLTTPGKTFEAEIQPQRGGRAAVELSITDATRMLALPFAMDSFGAKGVVTATAFDASELDARFLEGVARGKGRLTWGGPLAMDASFEMKQVEAHKIAPVLSGRLQGTGSVAAKGVTLDKLAAAARVEGNFTIQKGQVNGLDLARTLQSGKAMTGTTNFNELSAQAQYENGRLVLRAVKLDGGTVSANGSLEVEGGKSLTGKLAADMKTPAGQLRGTYTVSGTPAQLNIKR